MGASIINQLSHVSIPVYNAQVPKEGPKVMVFSLDFSQAPTYTLDGEQILTQYRISMVQSIWVDARLAGSPVTITVPASRQVVVVKNATQGYAPIISPNPFKFQFDCADVNAVVQVMLINVPMAPGFWPTA